MKSNKERISSACVLEWHSVVWNRRHHTALCASLFPVCTEQPRVLLFWAAGSAYIHRQHAPHRHSGCNILLWISL